MDALLRFVLEPARVPPTTDELRAWWDATEPQRAVWSEPCDRGLLQVAGKARAARRERAWSIVDGGQVAAEASETSEA